MKFSYLTLSIFCFFMSSVNAQSSNRLFGRWTLQIENPQHEVITTLIIHFTDDEAQSCLGGNWKQVVVDSYKTSDREFFPIHGSLSYDFDKNKVSIGRNEEKGRKRTGII